MDIDIDFIIPDQLVPVLESHGIACELLCDMEVWKSIIDEIDDAGGSYVLVIYGLHFPDEDEPVLEKQYEEQPTGQLLVDDHIDEFPAPGFQVYFQLYKKRE